MEFSEIIESYAASLVREYLHRKGLKTTLNALDIEFPRDAFSINSSSILARGLKMENAVRRNKCAKKPYKSILEVIIHHIKLGRKTILNKTSTMKKQNPPSLLTMSHLKSLHDLLNEKGHTIDFLTLIKIYCGSLPFGSLSWSYLRNTNDNVLDDSIFSSGNRKKSNFIDPDQGKRMVIPSDGYQDWLGKQNGIKRDENGEPSYEFDDKFYYTQKEPQIYTEKESSRLTEKENVLKSYLLGKSQVSESNDTVGDKSSQETLPQTLKDACSMLTSSSKRTLNPDRSTSPSPTKQSFRNFVHLNNKKSTQSKSVEEPCTFDVPNITFSDKEPIHSKNYFHFSPEEIKLHKPVEEDIRTHSNNTTEQKDGFINNLSECSLGVVIHEATQEGDLTTSECTTLKPQIDETSILKNILIAKNKTISKKWLGENLIFTKSPSYGLIQAKEGCSGVIASINAYIIKQLLFSENKNDVDCIRPTQVQLDKALISSMADILWQAGENVATFVILEDQSKDFDTIEDIVDGLTKHTFSSKNDLEKAIKLNISQYSKPHGHGCLLFLISAVLSHGVERVLDDMNGVSTLISSNGFSTIELVNLLLTGRAVSNVFDNNIKLKFSTIKGIAKRSDIGFLSIKEHFKCCKLLEETVIEYSWQVLCDARAQSSSPSEVNQLIEISTTSDGFEDGALASKVLLSCTGSTASDNGLHQQACCLKDFSQDNPDPLSNTCQENISKGEPLQLNRGQVSYGISSRVFVPLIECLSEAQMMKLINQMIYAPNTNQNHRSNRELYAKGDECFCQVPTLQDRQLNLTRIKDEKEVIKSIVPSKLNDYLELNQFSSGISSLQKMVCNSHVKTFCKSRNLQYLDLDLDSLNKLISTITLYRGKTEYREIDFLKTEALKKTKEKTEEYRSGYLILLDELD